MCVSSTSALTDPLNGPWDVESPVSVLVSVLRIVAQVRELVGQDLGGKTRNRWVRRMQTVTREVLLLLLVKEGSSFGKLLPQGKSVVQFVLCESDRMHRKNVHPPSR